jgi:hypothetical protein
MVRRIPPAVETLSEIAQQAEQWSHALEEPTLLFACQPVHSAEGNVTGCPVQADGPPACYDAGMIRALIIIGVVALVVARPLFLRRGAVRSTRSGVRFSVRWLIVTVLVVGLICGVVARWRGREARRQALIAHLHVQQQLTNSMTQPVANAVLRAAGHKNFVYSTDSSFSDGSWTERLNAYDVTNDGWKFLISVQVTGGCQDDVLQPITIKTSGGSMGGQLVDRMVRTYRDRGWQYEVVTLSTTNR